MGVDIVFLIAILLAVVDSFCISQELLLALYSTKTLPIPAL